MNHALTNISRDPEKNEINALLDFVGDLTGKRMLEIGAGTGRLTWRYAPLAAEVVGMDPKPERIATALKDMPKALQGRVTMLESTLEDYARKAQKSLFDMALMSWAL
jgi:predicted RNA methylase